MEWYEWVFNGIGVAIFTLIIKLLVEWRQNQNVDERFDVAVNNLEKNNLNIVLKSIRTLHSISVKHKNQRELVHEQFCVYLCKKSDELYNDINIVETPEEWQKIIQKLIDCLFKKDSIYKDYTSDLSNITLKNCNFMYMDIDNVILNNCTLEKCDFTWSNLRNCECNNVSFTTCYFGTSSDIEKVKKISYYGNGIFDYLFWNIFRKMNKLHDERGYLISCKFNNVSLIDCSFWGAKKSDCQENNVTTIGTFGHALRERS
jgi:hypothetical protein